MAMFDQLSQMMARRSAMVDEASALPGRDETMPVPERHAVTGAPMLPPYPEGMETAVFGLGCFWGVEREFWQTEGVYVTASGYAGGFTPNPTYEEVCSGRTGHAEAVQVVFDPAVVAYRDLIRMFWENHDPTQGMRQGNDVGTQYRSIILTVGDAQAAAAAETGAAFERSLAEAGYGALTTEIAPLETTRAGNFYFAEPVHQQYLAKNPNGYCPIHATGVRCGA
ncbi:peptide-methionine (S)-S-oxide reductase MsrA [Tomitella cavernea]|uniref:Peptide methionine sulfoxide reductase MsrA n=1 Tax=Tomitella cavernea TaxID=1387982 RepID=A0ABP9C4B5_9ACTN|nr:peptide-methionine (S)-S-oxide reductase MsrA [Tomitella cavernea]